MAEFRLTHESAQTLSAVDTLGFQYDGDFVAPFTGKLIHNTRRAVVAMLVQLREISSDLFDICETTVEDRTVLKVLHVSSKGVFYNQANSRVYLTKEEEAEAEEFFRSSIKRYKEANLFRDEPIPLR